MRRGMRHAHSLGNTRTNICQNFSNYWKMTMKNSYPELERAKDLILNTFLNEETKFKANN